MLYNFTDEFDCGRAMSRLQSLIAKKSPRVEITERKQRSGPQNRYLHVCIGIVALETGVTMEYCKTNYFKLHCNPSLFVVLDYDKLLNKSFKRLKSSRDLSVEEMVTAVDRFRNWAATEGIYIPSPEEEFMIQQAEARLNQNKQYL